MFLESIHVLRLSIVGEDSQILKGCKSSAGVGSFHDFVLARCPPNVRVGIEPANLSVMSPMLLVRERYPTDGPALAFVSLRCVLLFKNIRTDLY
jgi:hypothetical protein